MTDASLAAAVLVGAGGLCGALCRLAVDATLSGERGTVAVNVLGSAALGLVSVSLDGAAALALGTGFCGAFTTFSSLAVTVATRLDAGRYGAALRYGGGTLLVALAGVLAGRALGTLL